MSKTAVEIAITADSSNAVAGIQRTVNALRDAGDAATRVGTNFKALGSQIDAMGRQSMIALRAMGDAAQMAGLDRTLTQSVAGMAVMVDSIGDLSGALTMLNPTMLAVTAAGSALALVFNRIQEETRRAEAEIAKLKAPFEALRGEIESLSRVRPTEQLARELGISGDALRAYIASSQGAAAEARSLADAQESLVLKTRELRDAEERLNELREAFGADVEYAGQIAIQEQRVAELRREVERLTESYERQRDALGAAAERMNRYSSAATHYARQQKQDNAFILAQWDAQRKAEAEAAEAMKKRADALQRVADAQQNILRGLVERALTPTAVTEADLQAAAMGRYINKWDEFRRRAEAVLKGTDPSKFGKEFADALLRLGMPLAQIVEKFKNFSLFADPKNLKLVDWDAVTTDIGNQLLQLVGKANVMREGFQRAWASLTADQRRALHELGIESAGDVKKVLMGVADSGINGFVAQVGDKENQKRLHAAGDTLVKTIQNGMLDKESLNTWQLAFDSLVDAAIAELNIEANIKKWMDAGIKIIETIATGTTQTAALRNAMLTAVQDAIQAAIEYLGGASAPTSAAPAMPAVPEFAGGGTGIFVRSGLVRVHAGEQFWFSGVPPRVPAPTGRAQPIVNVYYSPAVSLATQSEAVGVIAPIVRQALRDATRRNL